MSALYQRARPVRFDEVIGQEHVKDVLLAGVRSGRVGHAYLFSGPRGVGKTTTARLLAMAVNCERPDVNERPCGVCESCSLVQTGSHPDVTELDAASNNSVEDVRDLREKVGLASLRGGMRVWILDEAHMLTRAASNALLKTLEEPPPGLVFVLATTEPEKLPATVLSRCQHFRFRRLSDAEIAGKLRTLCEASGVEAAPEALALVARAADGGMRDAESMLERLLVTDRPVTLADAEEALGLPPKERLEALASAVAAHDLGGAQAAAAALYRDGFSPRTLAEQLARTLRDALFEMVADGDGFRVPLSQQRLMDVIQTLDDDLDRFVRRGDLYALEVLLIKAMNTAARADGDEEGVADALGAVAVPVAPAAPAATAEPARTADRADGPAAGRPVGQGADGEADAAPDRKPDREPDEGTNREPTREASRVPRPEPTREPSPPPFEPDPAKTARRAPKASRAGAPAAAKPFSWHAVKTDANASPQLKAFLKPAQESIEGTVITLRYGPAAKFHFTQIQNFGPELAALLERVAGPGYTVELEGPDGGRPKKS